MMGLGADSLRSVCNAESGSGCRFVGAYIVAVASLTQMKMEFSKLLLKLVTNPLDAEPNALTGHSKNMHHTEAYKL